MQTAIKSLTNLAFLCLVFCDIIHQFLYEKNTALHGKWTTPNIYYLTHATDCLYHWWTICITDDSIIVVIVIVNENIYGAVIVVVA